VIPGQKTPSGVHSFDEDSVKDRYTLEDRNLEWEGVIVPFRSVVIHESLTRTLSGIAFISALSNYYSYPTLSTIDWKIASGELVKGHLEIEEGTV